MQSNILQRLLGIESINKSPESKNLTGIVFLLQTKKGNANNFPNPYSINYLSGKTFSVAII